MTFELNNEQRKYLGLELVAENWEKVILKGDSYRPSSIIYFDKNTIKKQVISTEFKYSEIQYNEETKDREFLLPKTQKGKPKKLTSSTLESKTPIGTYFDFGINGITIGNHTTQNTFYSTHFENIKFKDISELKNWVTDYIKNSTSDDLKSIEKFSSKKRKRIKLKQGDFFAFKVDRRNYGFGRLIYDLRPLRKDLKFKANKNYGIMNLMTQPLVIKIYHCISSTKEIDLNELKTKKSIPAQYIMDNVLFYGNYEIIGNQPLAEIEYDFPISYSKSIHFGDFGTVYLQYGLIYKETTTKKYDKHLAIENSDKNAKSWEKVLKSNPYRIESIGANLNFHKETLENCIKINSNQPYWESEYYELEADLRNPKNKSAKKDIFEFFNLNPNGTYYENLKK
ncbi:immunity 26/phosphotriesterase HocA family protein [Tenacibaculum soleae]|uniref:immunity 26/phosphotriesterase HocA family protein n=1 Tax=Tenacibaculum soleae TaxID=447689 RepID=UPI0026E27854|nr:immunity 26/phosphotriesterase HocA family protein [Tenacibaculum soleae]MDO6814067.1 immunity 26/phosphotriesterase HocA family protein [Tenacibaculum soleae]